MIKLTFIYCEYNEYNIIFQLVVNKLDLENKIVY